MKIDQLKALRAVVETGTVKAASEALNKTQPAISQALKTMEFRAGAKLFDRSGYRLKLTSLGERVYLQSLRVLAEAEDLGQLIRHFELGQEEKITIALDDNTDTRILTPTLRQLQATYPETRVITKSEILSGTITALKQGDADLAIAPMLNVALEEEGFEHHLLYRSAMRNVAAPDLIKKLQGATKLTDLRRHHQVLVSDSGDSHGMFDREFGVQKGQRRWYVSSLQLKKQLLVEGLGWGRLPSHLIEDDIERGALIDIELEHTHSPFDMNFFVFRVASIAHGPVATFVWDNIVRNSSIR